MAISIRYPHQTPLVDASGLVNSLADLGDLYQTRRADDKAADAYGAWMQASQAPQQQPMTLASLAPQGGVQRAPLEAPMDPASARVASAHAASGGTPPQGAIEAYIRHAAQKRGIDPEVAVKVAMSEGGVTDPTRQSDVVKDGVREQSYGPFQLYMNGGLGNEAMAAGIDPRTDWKGGIDFALDRAREGGWGPWYGAEKVGVTGMMGIGGQQQAQPQQMAQMAQMEPQGAPMGAGESLLPPPEVMKALLRSPSFKPLAIDMMRTAQAARQGDPEAELRLRKLRAEVEDLENPNRKPNIINAGDGKLYNANTGQWIDGPQQGGAGGFRFGGSSVEAQSLNGLIESGQITPQQAMQLGAGKTITGPNGEIIFMTPQGVFGQPPQGGEPQPIGGHPSGNIPITEPKVTLDEKKAMTFADRMTTSGKIIEDMGMAGSGKIDQMAGGIPGVGEYLTSNDFKKVDQAKRDFINAQLRRESGAVIADSEFDNANKQYFPQPNDPPEVLEQKRRNRQIVIDGMVRDGGPTYQPPGASGKGNRTSSGIQWSIEE